MFEVYSERRTPRAQSIQSARLSLQSSVLAPALSPASECCPLPRLITGGGTHSLAGEGMGGPNSDEGTATFWYSRYSIIPLRLTKSKECPTE
jgi:hypothetical protein